MITPRYGEALQWADALHREQRRKGKQVSYISHLIASARWCGKTAVMKIRRSLLCRLFAWRVSTSGMEWISTATRWLPATSSSSNCSRANI